MLVAAASADTRSRGTFAAAVLAALPWRVTYTLSGVVGNSLFVDTQVAIVAAVAAAVMVTIIAQGVNRQRC